MVKNPSVQHKRLKDGGDLISSSAYAQAYPPGMGMKPAGTWASWPLTLRVRRSARPLRQPRAGRAMIRIGHDYCARVSETWWLCT